MDYHNHTNEDLLGARPPSEVGDTSTKNAPDSSANRDEEDEEDPFQEDERQVDPGRTATISHNLQTTPQPTPSTSMPPPSLPSRTLTEPTSSAPAAPSLSPLDLINQQKRTFTQQHRATATPTLADFRQRHPWSNEDAEMLIHLIGERHAAWSLIERADKSKFQRPRHQQAYRDKARNMKVDFLMTDAVLPPCFDLVTLGKKEIDRLINYGKNPFRREKDVNTTGRAINTEYNG